jgi:hypothetical protein
MKASIDYNASIPRQMFPKMVHSTWKDTNIKSAPYYYQRWRSQCQYLNSDYNFTIHSDESMDIFTKRYFKQYYEMYSNLNGIYRIDMARFLLLYHYGGIYMDLDFYCYKPFSCLLTRIVAQYDGMISNNSHILLVSHESKAHATLLRNKSRIVIQDFFTATPKHPFIKWLLGYHYDHYERRKHSNIRVKKGPFSYSIDKYVDQYACETAHVMSSQISLLMNSTSNVTDQQINEIIESIRAERGYIIELEDDYLHPLMDFTNSILLKQCSREKINLINAEMHAFDCEGSSVNITQSLRLSTYSIYSHRFMLMNKTSIYDSWNDVKTSQQTRRICYRDQLNYNSDNSTISSTRNTIDYYQNQPLQTQKESLPEFCKVAHGYLDACRKVLTGSYFNPSPRTIAVHMWSHIYLGWNFIRMLFNRKYYHMIENALPPTLIC